MRELAELRVVQCHTDAGTATDRIVHRTARIAHADRALLEALEAGAETFEGFRRLAMEAPSIDVDTTSGYDPSIDEIVAFVNA